MSEAVDVIFLRPNGIYGEGERVGFAPSYADDLVRRNIARMAPDREPEHVRAAKAKAAAEKSKPEVAVVVFVEKHKMYNIGERAGFAPGYAEQLVNAKIAMPSVAANEEHAEPEPVEADEPIIVPTIGEVIASGYPPAAARGVVARAQALADGKTSAEADAASQAAVSAYEAAHVFPWGENDPDLEEFVEYFKKDKSKDQILAMVPEGLDVDSGDTKAELLEAIYLHVYGE